MTRQSVVAIVVAMVGVFALATTTLAFTLFAALGGPLAGGGCGGDGGVGGGSQQIGPRNWSAEQTGNAQTITAAAIARQLPRRAAVVAVSTAIVEAQLVNVRHGDRDSLGLFQQRPSQGWGTIADVLNPSHAANEFYDHLVAIPSWQTMPPGQAAQRVQRSAFPDRYAPQEAAAADLVGRFWTGPDNPTPPPPSAPAAGGKVQLTALTGCLDQGGSNLQLGPSTLDARKLPPGFVLPTDSKQRAAVSYALAQVGKPYLWGAKGPNAFDCSGLMLAAWATAGIPISGGTVAQVHDGSPVADLDLVSAGDLLFIPGSLGTPSNPRHVGMYAGNGIVVDAYDTSKGVILEKLTDWKSKIVAIRHIAGPTGPASALATTAS